MLILFIIIMYCLSFYEFHYICIVLLVKCAVKISDKNLYFVEHNIKSTYVFLFRSSPCLTLCCAPNWVHILSNIHIL